ncbi:MAG: hypothetical protein HY834_01095 [Devosia nanyangense]|uniref:Uncharacterized protein n=1 Tax=Devosia nanyangense TaxID=1228055 RepID=A0A933KX99_9HYPH|nr:hypothetical protein [Devosia nanyangense]
MTTLHRFVTSLVLAALATTPAFAGGFAVPIDRAVVSGAVIQPERCDHGAALAALGNQGMMLISELPRTPEAYRFDVGYKRTALGVMVYVNSCAVRIVAKAQYTRPWCEYLPGAVANCFQEFAQSQ